MLIGWLSFSSQKSEARFLDAFKEGLAELGWREGAQVSIEERWANGNEDRLQSFVSEFAVTRPALVVATGGRVVSTAVKGAPGTPIIMVGGNDPVAAGFAKSLARPGGMVTGITGFSVDLAEKHLELLLAAVPKVRRVGFLAYSNNPNHASIMNAARRSATRHPVEAHFAEVASSEEIERAMSRLTKAGVDGLIVLPGAIFSAERGYIVRYALARRWPVVGGPGLAAAGGLLSYGADIAALYRRSAHYADRLLKGAKPADLAIERPTNFELIVNLRTAAALGISIPEKFLLRADRVIE